MSNNTAKTQIQKLQEKNKRQREVIENLRNNVMQLMKEKIDVKADAEQNALNAHNTINNFIRTVDECEGDFWMSDLRKLRESLETMRKQYNIKPPLDENGETLYYAIDWVVRS
tara:strand:+ start:185 stop:523 length:339 start_codon:yes stop_codon:yes gene_type:complete